MPGANSNWEPGLGKIEAMGGERAALGWAGGNHGQMMGHDTVRTNMIHSHCTRYQFQENSLKYLITKT